MKWQTTTMDIEYNEGSGIVTIRPIPSFSGPETLEHAEENLNSIDDQIKDLVKGALAYLPDHYIDTKATRHYKDYASNIPIALVGASFFKKMIGNFVLAIAGPKRPMKLFTEEENALNWLNDKIKEGEISKAG